MTRRVLVTRPEPGASRTAQRLAALGLTPLVLPLSETRPLVIDRTMLAETISAVAITSANAIGHAPPDLLEKLTQLPCLTVGGRTAQMAEEAGFSFVLEGPGDADGLARSILERRIAGPIVYLCGRVRRPEFERRLASAAIAVIAVETYDTCPTDHSTSTIEALFGQEPVDAALLYSVAAADAMLALMARPDCADLFETAEFCCLSGRIAEVLQPLPGAKIRIAAEPTEAALLSLIA